ncbi:MAG: universal stress protein, partial [Bacteroidota bacterium]
FSDIMKENSTKEFGSFTKSISHSLLFKPELLEIASASHFIQNEVQEGNYDLVILGSKGQSAGSLLLLGSTSEQLIQTNNLSLTWVVKKKDENIGFFEALKQV